MADTKKMAYKDALTKALEFEGMDAEVVDRLKDLRASLAKKAENRKPTKTQEENEVIKKVILESLAKGEGTATEIGKRAESTADLSNQKITSLLKQLIESGQVVKSTEGRKSIFALAE